MLMPSTAARSVKPPQPVWRYDPVAARSVTATLHLAAGAIGLTSAALPGWPGGSPTVIAALSVIALACGIVLLRLREVPYRLALVLTGSANLALAAVFLFYSPGVVAAQAGLAMAAQAAVLYLNGAGRTAPATVVLTIGSACATGLVIRNLAGLRTRAEQELAWQASHDGLTGLPNRLELLRHWRLALATNEVISTLVLDLRGFKKINDEQGHHCGDAVLVEVGRRLSALAEPAMAVRLGGDEFAVLLPGISAGEAGGWAVHVSELLHDTYRVSEVDVPLRATVGVATHRAGAPIHPSPVNADGQDASALSAVLAAADAAMYRARRLGRSVAAADQFSADSAASAIAVEPSPHDMVSAHLR
ncbi:diguanylate cyclase domain-containing protein [Micromonosporaceae bacterium Da 78-11]